MQNKLSLTTPNCKYNNQTLLQLIPNQQNSLATHIKMLPTIPNANYNNQTPLQSTTNQMKCICNT